MSRHTGVVQRSGQKFKVILRIKYDDAEFACIEPDDNNTVFYTSLIDVHKLVIVDVLNFTISEVPKLIQFYLSEIETEIDAVDYFVFHQANEFILKQVAK